MGKKECLGKANPRFLTPQTNSPAVSLSMQAVLPRPGTTENPPENVDFWPG
jgi:hypothetical protein